MKKVFISVVLAAMCLFIQCEEKECCVDPGIVFTEYSANAEGFLGTWQVYEYGYSPGAGYFTVDVPSDPLQFLEFSDNHVFSSNYRGLEEINYFFIIDDAEGNSQILALFEAMPSEEDIESKEFDHSYHIWATEKGINLTYRYCIEGCHIGIEKIVQ